MGAARAAVGWFRGRLLLTLLVVAVVLEVGRLGCLLEHWGEGPWLRCLQVLFGVNRGDEKREGLTNSCVLPV